MYNFNDNKEKITQASLTIGEAEAPRQRLSASPVPEGEELFYWNHKINVLNPPMLVGGLHSHNDFRGKFGEIGLDWIRGSFPYQHINSLVDYMSRIIGISPVAKDYGRYFYNRSFSWEEHNVHIYYDDTFDNSVKKHAGKATIELCGSFVGMFDAENLQKLCFHLVAEFWLSGTRIDVSFDDYDRHVEISDINDNCCHGNFSGFRTFQYICDTKSCVSGPDIKQGESINFGKRGCNGSGRFLRIYDKKLESKGEVDCIRWELELSDKHAKEFLLSIAFEHDINKFTAKISSVIGGAIKFVQRKGVNLKRMQELSWWSDIVDILGRCDFKSPRKKETIEKKKEWVLTQVATSLAMIEEVLQEHEFRTWISELLLTGKRKFSKKHKAIMNEHMRENYKQCMSYFENPPKPFDWVESVANWN